MAKAKKQTWPARIRALRKRLGLKQEELALKVHVTSVTVSRWETNRAAPSPMAQAAIIALEKAK